MVKNGGPDLKRAQRTGLSARRARRTKSSRPEGPKAGPKGRYLEVGARRAPRLLVLHMEGGVYQDPQNVLRNIWTDPDEDMT